MKKTLLFLCVVLMVFGMTGSASAISYSYSDTYSANSTYMAGHLGYSNDDTIGWTFDITDDGFNPDTQDITSASVLLNFTDDSSSRLLDRQEFATLDLGTNSFRWEVDTGDVSFTIRSLMTLSDDGTVDATLTATKGDFYFNSATLNAEGTEPGSGSAPVPEPSTTILMGLGLLGLMGYGRKKLIKKS